nr:aspartate kinase [Porphyromonas endodontalis]
MQSQTHNEAFTQNDEKRILSRGEIISTTLMAFTLREYENLNAVHLDALSFMRINHNGEPEPQHIEKHLTPLLTAAPDPNALFLTEGYICINAFGEIDNLRRGGSDYTATLVGEAAHAEAIEIWTDIDGLHNNDPRVVNVTSPVRRLHFGEAAELAHFGSKILHPTCIEPARRANIPIRLLNTLDPQAPGTLISCETSRDMVKAVSAKDGISLLILRRHPHIKSGSPLSDYVIAITQLIAKHNLCVDLLTTMGDSYLIAVEEAPEVAQFAEEAKEWGSVLYQKDMTIVAVVGDMGWDRMGFESRILDAIDDIPIRMISYGSSNYSLVLVVGTVDKKRAMIALSDHLFANINLQSPEIG